MPVEKDKPKKVQFEDLTKVQQERIMYCLTAKSIPLEECTIKQKIELLEALKVAAPVSCKDLVSENVNETIERLLNNEALDYNE